jgi:transcriptional regulator with XRE-family HTH domain
VVTAPQANAGGTPDAPGKADAAGTPEAAGTPDAAGQADAAYARAVGERLRQVRQRKRLSLQGVELLSTKEFKASVLGAYERGDRIISVPRLRRLAVLYDVPVDALLPASATSPDPRAGPAASGGDVELDARIAALAAQDPESVARYLRMIRGRRRSPEGAAIAIREEDVRAMELLFGVPPPPAT